MEPSQLSEKSRLGAFSEPKLFRKNTVFTKNRRQMRQTINSKPGPRQRQQGPPTAPAPSASGSEADMAAADGVNRKLQRQGKGQSRKTFKFRKTRKDVRKLMTMAETIGGGGGGSEHDEATTMPPTAKSQPPSILEPMYSQQVRNCGCILLFLYCCNPSPTYRIADPNPTTNIP